MAVAAGVHALPQITPSTPLAPAIPLNLFDTKKFAVPLSLDDILGGNFPKPSEIIDNLPIPKPAAGILGGLFPSQHGAAEKATVETEAVDDTMSIQATCSNPRVRQEWDSYSNSDRQAFVSAVRCLMGKAPSGQFSQSKSRYEDLVALHQTLTPNVHGSSKFLIWHRYYLWTFEDMLRSECGFDRNLPWWDETRYSGNFAASSIFSSQWLGSINTGGNCVTDGVSSFNSHLLVCG
jgi:tyrosinase